MAHPGPAVRVQNSKIQGQARSACKLYFSKFVTYAMTWSVSGNHGQSSQCTGGRPGCTRTRMPSDLLCVCQVHRNRPTVQPGPVSQSGGGPATSLLPSLAVQPNWASGKSKLMSGPVTSWPERGAALDPRPTSDVSQKAPCVANVMPSVCRPCFIHIFHPRVHADGVMVKATGCYA